MQFSGRVNDQAPGLPRTATLKFGASKASMVGPAPLRAVSFVLLHGHRLQP